MAGKKISMKMAARIFGKSVKTMRLYKGYQILKPCARDGNKELFDETEVRIAKRMFDDLCVTHTIAEIAEAVRKNRAARSKRKRVK